MSDNWVNFVGLVLISISCLNLSVVSSGDGNDNDFFVKHSDPLFQDDVPEEFTACIVKRSLTGQGFHRKLETNVTILLKESVEAVKDCRLLLKETLSSSLYIDGYECDAAHAFGGPLVYSSEDIDLEKPEFLSPSLNIFVYNALKQRDDNILSSNVSLPLHVRYHRPHSYEEDYIHQSISNPEVFISCSADMHLSIVMETAERILAPCSDNTHQDCTWSRLICQFPIYSDSDGSISFMVPVGKLNHYPMVAMVTMLTIVACTVSIVMAMLCGFNDDGPELLKKNT